MDYPKELTADLSEVLGMPMWRTGPIAHAFQAAGHDIPRKAEAEQAFVLHWLTGLVLEHGAEWRKVAADTIDAMAAKAGKPIKKSAADAASA